MFLSIYTFVRNGLFYDYHVVDMLKHHLPLADEIVVNEGFSTDGTWEAIKDLDPKIRVFRAPWGEPKGEAWFAAFKNEARARCRGEWCLLLDCDEFIPEWEFDGLRQFLRETAEDTVPVNVINFYANYKVYNARPQRLNWPARKMILHRNRPDVEVWGDGSNVRLRGTQVDWARASRWFTCHHFGMVRHPARLRQKWRNVQAGVHTPGWRNWFKLPRFLFDWCPHDWKDANVVGDLAAYDGPYVRAVRDNPDEFVRDGFALSRWLEGRQNSSLAPVKAAG